MTSSLSSLHSQSFSIFQQPSLSVPTHRMISPRMVELKRAEFVLSHCQLNRVRVRPAVTRRNFRLRAVHDSITPDGDQSDKHAFNLKEPVAKFRSMISTLPPVVFAGKRVGGGGGFVMWLSVATVILVIFVRMYVVRKPRYERPGSVADLVRRGQLRSDRRGISQPLIYDDPFNNPMVKVGKSNSTVEMCGKVYRLAPVTLTKEEQAIHQKRRSRAYQWKRPTVFLKEGDSIPPDVDPETVRWIPANHPFATTVSDIDEGLAQNNVYQQHGVPFRIKAEHEALQRKLEALQNDQKLNKLVIDNGYAKDFERPFKFNPKSNDPVVQGLNPKSNDPVVQGPFDNQAGERPSKSEHGQNSHDNSSSSDEMKKP